MGPAPGIGILLVGMVTGNFPPALQSVEPPEHFVYQRKAECGFPDGAGAGAFYLDRYFWGRQELLRFDSRRGSFEAITALGESDAALWNSQKDFLDTRKADLDRFCRRNYGLIEPFVSARRMKPQLEITSTYTDPSAYHVLLVCTVADFFPAKLAVKWLRNGQEEDESRVVSTELIRNGDWTFSIHVMLETQPEHGDVYACQVEHTSLPGPTSVQWEPQSESTRSKMWTGVVGLLLGLVFVVPGLVLYLKNRKGTVTPPPTGLIS